MALLIGEPSPFSDFGCREELPDSQPTREGKGRSPHETVSGGARIFRVTTTATESNPRLGLVLVLGTGVETG
jgi:hypothetical protein